MIAQTVYIVDDDEAVRSSLVRMVSAAGMNAVAMSSAEEFIGVCSARPAGCLVLDVRMPGMSGLELQTYLIRERITLPVIMLSGHADIPMAVEATRRGAMDFIEKPPEPSVLLDRIREALRLDLERRTAEDDREVAAGIIATLTGSQRVLLSRLVRGQSVESVARDLSITDTQALRECDMLTRQIGPNGFAVITRVLGRGEAVGGLT
ncbi:MAG: response regulator [Planctomycetaceae bacterium]|jgi:two-component system response regulator FixJ|nr:response regulator transcription factor [Phycisphaerales bacterium]MCE2653128.1 response regulator [Planctomycetaceae bacterium]